MRKYYPLLLLLALSIGLAFVLASLHYHTAGVQTSYNTRGEATGHGNVDTLKAALRVWGENYEARGGSPDLLKISLGYSQVISAIHTQARGTLEINLKTGSLLFESAKLEDGQYALWLIDNRNGSIMPESGDSMVGLGGFEAVNGKGRLQASLERNTLLGLNLDAVVLTKAGLSPVAGVILYGAPDLMHKLYYAGKPWLTTALGGFKTLQPEPTETGFGFLLPKTAQADTVSDLTPLLGALVANGRQLFHHETFAGNGRTCGTCHRADNNFTLDPNYIKNLPASDALFVAETNPALNELEDSVLLRKQGLIKTNVDGPGVDIFRSVPHTLSLATTAKSETLLNGGDFAADEAFANATGWSGDGAPGSGSLREFTLGAVAQHMPKTMHRIANIDFRLPNEDELDAIEAYILSLGRSKDYPVYKLNFNDPLTQAGKLLLDTKQNPCSNNTAQVTHANPQGGYNAATCPAGQTVVQGQTANCNGCHQNAGGRSSTTNANPTRNTGVEQLKINPARLLRPELAYDGGFGSGAAGCRPDGDTCYGDGRFNTPPLIEAADTAPYFHNNVVSTLEEAIASYNSDAFNNSPGALTSKNADRRIKLDATQIVAVASFLRAINALENIRLSDQLDNQAKQIANNATARELAKLAWEENQDAIQVLKEGVLGTNWKAAQKLEQAAYYQNLALLAPNQYLRKVLLQSAQSRKSDARLLIAGCNPDAAPPSTVVVPPAGYQYECSEIGW